MKPGRNDRCPCGSGRKYKNCCLGGEGAGLTPHGAAGISPVPMEPGQLLALFNAGRFAELESLLKTVVERPPQSAFLWTLLGASVQAQGRNGIPALQHAIKLSPRDVDAHIGLARAFLEHGHFDKAAATSQLALAIQPENPGARFALGDTLRVMGDFEAAAEHLQRALRSAPDFVEALVSLAVARLELGQLDDAERLCRRAIQLAPQAAPVHFCLGNILVGSARLEEAQSCFLAALQFDPGYVPALDNLGNVLQELGKFAQAEECYRQALKLDPGHANANANLGRLLLDQSRFVDAEVAYRDALKAQPQNPDLLERLGGVLLELGQTDAARSCYQQALTVQPDRASTRLALATVELPVIAQSSEETKAVAARFARALDGLADWLHADRAGPGRQMRAADLATAQQPFFLAYRRGNHVDLLARYGDLVGECLAPHSAPSPPQRSRPRLLIVSHHVRRHSVWDIVLRGLLLNRDRRRFEVVVYHLGNAEDEETTFARSLVDGWRDRHTLSDPAAWLAAAAEDCPDAIFYPEIGMSSLSYFLAAHRLAPLQLASWGHPISTGLASIDVFLSGELLEADDADAHYRERLLRLPGTGCCTATLPLVAEPIPDVEASLRARSGVRFVIAQRAIKFDPLDDALYARIAAASGESVFILLRDPVAPWASEQVLARLAATFAANGLDPERQLLAIPWLPPAKFLALLDLCNVYLDCPAFSGYTTAWQALHRGLPIVTLEGPQMRQRLASGLLRKAGVGDTIASSADEYVAIAAHLADECHDDRRRQERRARIRAAAPSVDGDLQVVRAFEQFLCRELAALRRPPTGPEAKDPASPGPSPDTRSRPPTRGG